MRAKAERLEHHHFRFTIRGMTGDIDVAMDGAKPAGPTPKELLLAALCSCTGTDVVDLLKKFEVTYDSLELEARANITEKHPKVFESIDLTYTLTSTTEKTDMIIEAVKRSTHQYSSTAAILSKTCPIRYKIILNTEVINEDVADFTPRPR